jgi:excisionase family DNA binding protein
VFIIESPLLTLKETAEYLKVSNVKMYQLVRSKDFPSIKVSGLWRVIKKDLDRWIEAQKDEKPEYFTMYR